MAQITRYSRTPVFGGGTFYGTSYIIPTIRQNIANGNVQYTQITLDGSERLDTLAGKYYGDAGFWWIIAAASNVGWGLQVPNGTLIIIPKLSDLMNYIQ